jgi:hypothetical protein
VIANSGLGLSEKGGVKLAGIWISSLYVIRAKIQQQNRPKNRPAKFNI